ncbi:nitroreductase family protein [Streptomyces sp. NBC_01423]|uniref:nitroreductase family protein n=1 Tax=Streptomyces sp. NBC_01423 TaxID=2903860 RepID=UPI002E283ECD|nr:nitroreductase family protein [Streptomyces sp. NBC_01423]
MVLSLLDEGVLLGGDGRPRGTRAVPSAGAVYPYEFAAIVMEGGHPSAFRIDGDRRHCTRLASGARVATCLTSSGLSLPPDGGAVVITLIRPWLSMRKYGDRGYLYAQLDAGHAVGNLLFASAGRGAPGVLRSRFPRSPLTELLKASENFREVHSAVVLGPMAARPFEAAWTMHDGTGQAHREAAWKSWLERACWESLGARPTRPEELGTAGMPSPLVDLLPHDRLHRDGAGLGESGTWPGLLAARSSSKAFAGGPVPADDIWQAVSALTTAVVTDLPGNSSLAATLVIRSAAETEQNGVYPLTREGRRAGRLPSGDEMAKACMQQQTLVEAAAVVLMHAPRAALEDFSVDGPEVQVGTEAGSLGELALRCGALGQMLYLGATRAGIGVTGIGGFDAAMWRSLAGLPENDEVLYVLLLGRPDDSGIKLDRLGAAIAQNEQ